MAIRRRRGGNAGMTSWSDRGIEQPVWQYAYQELTYTADGKAEESKEKQKKNGTTARAGFKRRKRSQEGQSVPNISARLLCEGENSRRKRTQQGNTKTPRNVSPVSKSGRKRPKESEETNNKTLRAFPPVSTRGRKRSKENARTGDPKASRQGG